MGRIGPIRVESVFESGSLGARGLGVPATESDQWQLIRGSRSWNEAEAVNSTEGVAYNAYIIFQVSLKDTFCPFEAWLFPPT